MAVKNDDFASLHMHSDRSLLDGFATPQEYVQKALDLGQRALGLTDHGNLFAINTFINSARSAGLTPVPGCEFYMAPVNPEGSKVDHPVFYGRDGRKDENYDVSANGAYLHLTVWAYNNTGMDNLKILSSESYEPSRVHVKQRIDFEMLADHSEGLIVTTGCPSSEVCTRLLMGQDREAFSYAGQLKEVFGDKMFVEIMDHSMDIDLERILLPKQLEISKKLGIPLLATNDCHYAHEHDAQGHEEMLCIQSGALMSHPTYEQGGKRFAFNGNGYYMKTSQEMERQFPKDDFPGAISNTLLIAEMASDITLDFDAHLKPKPVIPAGFTSEGQFYQHLINQGYQRLYVNRNYPDKATRKRTLQEATRRIMEEWNVINSSDFVGYMLVVRDYLNRTENDYSVRDKAGEILASSVGVGRGSVGGSIHAYLLGISKVDPIEHDLLFERFLSPGRGAVCLLTFDDGSTEEVIVSDERVVMSSDGSTEKRYVHQISVGDTIVCDEQAA